MSQELAQKKALVDQVEGSKAWKVYRAIKKGLVMGNILWSVDKKIYSDKEDHTLAITGWAITRDQSECEFILYGSGKELSVPEPSRCERADVAKDLKKKQKI